MENVIDIVGLIKSFGTTRALTGLDLKVQRGQAHGFLGPNGSGKSTTIRILLGLLRADAGQVRLLGGDPWRDTLELHQRLAYVPGEGTLWPNLTGGEIIDLLGRLRGGIDRRRREELLDQFDLDPSQRSQTYSKGDRQKVTLIAALAADVELLLLDEPTSGLDPLMAAVFQECVMAAHDQGRTVLLSSHILTEVEALCDHVSIIRAGRIVETGNLAEMRHLRRTTLTAELAGRALSTGGAASLAALAGVHHFRTEGSHVVCEVDPAALTEVLRRLTALGLRSLISQPPTLEELFLRHYADPERVTEEWHRMGPA